MRLPTDLVETLREMEQDSLKNEAARDRANKHYSSTVFEGGLRYRFFELKLPKKRVRFCYTVTANALGCYLSFTETISGKRKMTAKREHIAPHDTRREAKAWALKKLIRQARGEQQ